MNNKKRLFSLVLVLLMMFILTACGKNRLETLWDTYVNAVNNQDLEAVSLTLYPSGNLADKFVEENEDYFERIKKIEPISFVVDEECDFSDSVNTQVYYLATAKATVTYTDLTEAAGSTAEEPVYNEQEKTEELEFTVYGYTTNVGIYFCSDFDFVDENNLGNQPNTYWNDKFYYTNEDVTYRYNYREDNIQIIRAESNERVVTIPSELNGKPVAEILPYAYFQFNKTLSFSTPISKMRELIIPDTVVTIGEFAFTQCTKLKQIVIPESIRTIGDNAFTGCSGATELYINFKTTDHDAETVTSNPESGELVIEGAHNMLVGEIQQMAIYRSADETTIKEVKWSITSGSDFASINADTGVLTARASGNVTVTVALKNNPLVKASVVIAVSEVLDFVSISHNAFDRCSGLESIYISASNPNSIKIINGTKFNLSSTVTIYVPKGSKEMYSIHSAWSTYSKQIVEMSE